MPFDGQNRTISPLTQILVDGRQRLDQGWCQHRARQRDSACMIGSLVISDYEEFVAAERLLLDAIVALGHAPSPIAQFNDAPGRTKQQVLQVYDHAIRQSSMMA